MNRLLASILIFILIWAPKYSIFSFAVGDITVIDIISIISFPFFLGVLQKLRDTLFWKFYICLIISIFVPIVINFFFYQNFIGIVYIIRFLEYLSIASLAFYVGKNFLIINIFSSLFLSIFLFNTESLNYHFRYIRWEPVMIASFISIYLVYSNGLFNRTTLLFNSVFLFLLFLSGQRSPILPFIYQVIFRFRIRIIRYSPIFLILIFLIIYLDNPVKDRIITIFNPETIQALRVATELNPEGYDYEYFVKDIEYGRLETDVSSILRFRKWIYHFFTFSWDTFLFGKGSFSFGKGADSSLVRVFVENGLIGIVILAFLLFRLHQRLDDIDKSLLSSFFILGLLIDTWFSASLAIYFGFISIYKNKEKE
tara:strand:+ start:1517 stop:2620 length:1104 start_codon:yes stop_codon:yes gene_type:complete